MRKLVPDNSTVDGVIDMAADWFDPLAKDFDQSPLQRVISPPRLPSGDG